MQHLYPFPGTAEAPLSEVGGKGRSLIVMAERGLPVPPGFVLGVSFFEQLDEEQQSRALAEALPDGVFAVRSSSPEEDLEGASFAGIYESLLSVAKADVPAAVKRVFASCKDPRVAAYKAQRGFDPGAGSIAVIVQKMVDADVAGVGFSLNPVTNDYDESVINANWGLGETVVSGSASPDTFRVDRVRKRILERRTGAKETSTFMSARKDAPAKSKPCLTDQQIIEVSDLIGSAANHYGNFIDIEWAYEKNRLFLLQARPVTTHLQLPAAMVTAAGRPRCLYLDLSITVQGLLRPISVMGTSCIRWLLSRATRHVFGKDLATPDSGALVLPIGGRIYLNLTNLFELIDRDTFFRGFSHMDPLAVEMVKSAPADLYRAANPAIKSVKLNVLWHLPEKLLHILEARLLPDAALQRAHAAAADHVRHLRLLAQDESRPLQSLADELFQSTVKLLFVHYIPLLLVSRKALSQLRGMFGKEHAADVEKLDRSLPGNVTVEMGLELYRLSQVPEERFPAAWREFLDKYGHRGPEELDIRSPRYRDRPEMLLSQIVQLRTAATNPLDVYESHQQGRHMAYLALGESVHDQGWLQTQRFHSLYRVLEKLGGLRETGKFHLILALDVLRQRLLKLKLDLDRPEDVFDLELEDVIGGGDLRKKRLERLAEQAPMHRFRDLPRIVDSRGRIGQLPRWSAAEGEVSGLPVSAGTARGPVRVLHRPDEKTVKPGDILVARATDPGWTPLFVNAAAVVLEVGGMLQHGALVAREYGKPCVAGVTGATELWEDDTIVEVDGSAGVIRRAPADDPNR